MTEPQELEKTATAYASSAVLCEKDGETEKAVSLYQKAAECLNQLMQRFPNYGFTNIYTDRAALYQERVVALQESLTKAEKNRLSPKKPAASEIAEKLKEEARNISIDLTPFSLVLQEINRKLDEVSASRNENIATLDNTPVFQEINKKLDELVACISELKSEVGIIKVSVNDAVGKSEQTQKELLELRNLVYSIKYDR
jgi:hypothetical protein